MQIPSIFDFRDRIKAIPASNYSRIQIFYQKSTNTNIEYAGIAQFTFWGVDSSSRFLINKNLVGWIEISSRPSFMGEMRAVVFLDTEHLKQMSRCWKLMLLHFLQVQSSLECSNPNSSQVAQSFISMTGYVSKNELESSSDLNLMIALPFDIPFKRIIRLHKCFYVPFNLSLKILIYSG